MKLWIARDNTTHHDQLFLYYEKPRKVDSVFTGFTCGTLKKELFPEITFENSPQEIELKLKK